MNTERKKLQQKGWKKWGPYLGEREWGTVREDYSAESEPWNYTTYDTARSIAWRWSEDGIGGICDEFQRLCFSVSFWNKKDPMLKERLFGLTNEEGNHGEDVKEVYYYLDSTPTHSYMKMLYKYPQRAFPYNELVEENKKRSRLESEYELIDTGIFDADEYFDIFLEYAKGDADDILIKITVYNRSEQSSPINILPTIWFRNTWSWGRKEYIPNLSAVGDSIVQIEHSRLINFKLYCEDNNGLLFCNNESNAPKLYAYDDGRKFYKDGINDYIVEGASAINPARHGTKAAVNYDVIIPARQSQTFRLRLSNKDFDNAFADFEDIFTCCKQDADEFYDSLQKNISSPEEKMIHRQALAGMLWSKQFYHFDVEKWLSGDPGKPPPPPERLLGRNHEWRHLNNEDIISMPAKWEYPWYAAWDLAFHCVALVLVDPDFAKDQLVKLTHEWFMHPNGQLPAYEWAFGDANPPVHAWAVYRVYEIDKKNTGKGDAAFLETIFHKLLINFTWWVNRKDAQGNNIFQGGFLGMDNISFFDRSKQLPGGARLEQSDGTSWMAMYSLNLMRIALELAKTNPVYQGLATKFFEHFLYIAGAMNSMGENKSSLWDDGDEFYYDAIKMADSDVVKLKIRSMVGLVPLFAVEVLDDELLQSQPDFLRRMRWFLRNRPELATLVSRWREKGMNEKHLLSLLRGHRMKRILYRMLDETEFLSDYGVRSLSKYHELHPYQVAVSGQRFSVQYSPAESTTPILGGNSNWRGPVWMPVNFLIIESLHKFHDYYGDDFKVEYPTNSGRYFSLKEIALELSKRLVALFQRNERGRRPIFGDSEKMQTDPQFRDYLIFPEYFHGDNGRGVGASHQTGWTGLIANLLQFAGGEE